MFHSLALLAISAHPRLMHRRMAAGALALGSALFSGSIFGLVLLKSKNMSGGKILGPITPLGGILCCDVNCRPHHSCWMGDVDSIDCN